jgi:hypothetical protein
MSIPPALKALEKSAVDAIEQQQQDQGTTP